jgi:ribonuclease E/ribonuclease G
MSGIELLIDDIEGRLHAAVVRKTVLHDLYADPLQRAAAWASIYSGRVIKLDKNLDAAIIDLGNGLQGILAAKHVHYAGDDTTTTRSGITDLLDTGQSVVVQVKSEAKAENNSPRNKLPRLTMKIALIGQFLHYSPVAHQVTVSRDIKNDAILGLTSRLGGRGGWIVQSTAEHATDELIRMEEKKLLAAWDHIAAETAKSDDTPRLLADGPDAMHRVLNDYGLHAFDHINAGNKKILNAMIAWSEKNDPSLATSKRLRLFQPEQANQKLFDLHDVYGELETLSDRRVALNDGGDIVIEQTQALTVIDVNQGSTASIAEANQQAAREIARQVRLRGLSGAIIVDFIGMHQKSERLRLVEAVEEHFRDDYAQTAVHGFTRLGIIEITRKRRTATLAEKMKK